MLKYLFVYNFSEGEQTTASKLFINVKSKTDSIAASASAVLNAPLLITSWSQTADSDLESFDETRKKRNKVGGVNNSGCVELTNLTSCCTFGELFNTRK